MGTVRRAFLVCIVACSCLCAVVARAQEEGSATTFTAPHGFALPGTRSYLGLSLGRGLTATNCPTTQLLCESQQDRSAQLYAGRMFDPHWGAEVGFVDTGRLFRTTGEARAQGLNLSLVGRAHLSSFGVFGKVGTTYGRSDTSVMGNTAASGPEQGFGLSWGGGVSYDFSPRLSATFEWGSYDLRLSGGPVRATSLGLQYRY